MNVHRKSAIGKTEEMILSASDRGEDLLWERFERQLPLCGFTSNGLNCRKCFHGPCRINPFGDEPTRGICGADRDQIIMENLFQTTLDGVLETTRSLFSMGIDLSPELPDIGADLSPAVRKRLSERRLLPVRKDDLLRVGNGYFSDKEYFSRTLADLARLGLIQYGFLKMADEKLGGVETEPTAFALDGINILIAGPGPGGLMEALREQADRRQAAKAVNVFVQGAWAPAFAQRLVDHGDPELGLFANLDALIITPRAFQPALGSLARRRNIPVILLNENESLIQVASHAIEAAGAHAGRASNATSSQLNPAPRFQEGRRRLFDRTGELRVALEKGQLKGVLTIFGEANVKQSFFEATLSIVRNCLSEKYLVLIGGELGAQRDLLEGELNRQGHGGSWRPVRTSEDSALPVLNDVGPLSEIPKVITFIKGLFPGREFETLPVVFAFPEFAKASSWTTLISLFSMGFGVQAGSRLPFWGSPSLTGALIRDWAEITKGRLMVSAAQSDSRAQAQEIVSFLKEKQS
jgi:hypothetical protein